MKISVVYGPSGCGKTRKATKIADTLDCDVIFDSGVVPSEAAFRQQVADGHALILCVDPRTLPEFIRRNCTQISFHEIARKL